MVTIEERAKAISEDYDDAEYSAGLYMGYVAGATTQKTIDIENACKWIKENVECGIHPQSAYGFADRFLKAMKE